MKITIKYKKSATPMGSMKAPPGVICNDCFATSNKVVRPTIDERALAAGGAK